MNNPLSSIAEWPLDQVGAAAVLADGTVLRAGSCEHRFLLASVTKPLVALAVLVAVEEGTLGLDQPLGPPGATIRHLLAHASGVAPDSGEVLAPPGHRRIYSNFGFELLGQALADQSGIPIAQYLAEAVLQPLGLDQTVLLGSPAHGAEGTVNDLVSVAQELLRPDPQLLARTTRDQATAVAFPDLPGVLPGFGPQERNDWGLGFEIKDHKSPHWTPNEASPQTFGHFGRSGSLLWVDPTAQVALVVLGDREFGDWAPARWQALGTAVLAESRDRNGG